MSKIYCTKCGGQNFKYQCVSCADTNPSVQMTNSEIKKDELKPCPFCQKSMVDPYFDDMNKRWRVGCGRCGASSGIHVEKQQAIDAWNTRTPEPTKECKHVWVAKEQIIGHPGTYRAECRNCGESPTILEPTKAESPVKGLLNKLLNEDCDKCGIKLENRIHGINGFPVCQKCFDEATKDMRFGSKAENGLVRLDKDKIEFIIGKNMADITGCEKAAIEIYDNFFTPSITKEQLLAILPEEQLCDCFEEVDGIPYRKPKCVCKNSVIREMKQRIEELFKKEGTNAQQ